ncbi:hypothetical protein DAPPUDRAFT_97163 [Daphnia pulex]|uniref:Tetraspanin n=1 Tax=Daphnia pulex TaxID=6669 RepID=E9G0U7_DAPPU|nr:hypothetical protein DAPPUDRAFT_97163 [Daphnia pulex]|eukprot:EFX86968.1 hypothetical protein DAPPUDRAFT_97163 [Daphnia pulex]
MGTHRLKILAIVVMGLSLWLRYEWDFKHYVYELEAQKVFWTGPYILIASSSLAMAAAAIGVWATVAEDRQFLLLFVLVSGVSAILGLSGAAYTLSHGIFHSDLTEWLEDRFWVLFHEADNNERSRRIMRIIQEDIECCGPSTWQDYQDFNKVVPDECRNQATGNLSTDGCAEIFARWMEPKTGWLSGIALLLVVIQILSVGISAWLRKIISQERRNDKPYRVVSANTKV